MCNNVGRPWTVSGLRFLCMARLIAVVLAAVEWSPAHVLTVKRSSPGLLHTLSVVTSVGPLTFQFIS